MAQNDDYLKRRDFLTMGGSLAAIAGAYGLFPSVHGADVLTTGKYKAKAKAVIDIWLWGGPAHIDTFDPKPNAGKDYTGPLDKVVKANAKGMVLNASLPKLAGQADKFSLIRSMTHGINAHETASYVMRTGRKPGHGLVFPSLGAVVSRIKGYDNGYDGLIPPYVALTSPQGRFSEAGFLGPKYKPFATGGDPSKDPFAVSGVIAKGITEDRQRQRRALLGKLDSLQNAVPDNESFAEFEKYEKEAYELILGDARKVFDMTQEKKELRERYGMNKFGQSCLAARRLIESGVVYVSINHKGWDTHKQHFSIMDRKLPELDQGLAALLQDLKDRNMLDETVVICTGEFGRSPRVQWNEPWNGGRSHFGRCFSALVAGGGFKGGHVVGESDARAENVTKRPVHPQDLTGSVYQLLGIDPDGPMPNPRGLSIPILPKQSKGGRLKEIMES
jgi:hypothetical protein